MRVGFTPIEYRGHNGYDVRLASDEAAGPVDPGVSLTVQSQAEDCDLNVLMYRYGVTGKMPENPRVPVYGDFTGITDYRGALEAVMRAQESFMELPAQVRSRFENNPQLLLEFCEDPRNMEEARRMGLLKPPPEPDKVLKVEVMSDGRGKAEGVAVGGGGSGGSGASAAKAEVGRAGAVLQGSDGQRA